LSLTPAELTVEQGATGTATVTITRTNFTGAVTLSLGNAPSGVTGSFNPAAPTGTNSTLTVGVGAAVAPGVYNLTVGGTASPRDRGQPPHPAHAPALHDALPSSVADTGRAHHRPGRDRHYDRHRHAHEFHRRRDVEFGRRAVRGHGVVQPSRAHRNQLHTYGERWGCRGSRGLQPDGGWDRHPREPLDAAHAHSERDRTEVPDQRTDSQRYHLGSRRAPYLDLHRHGGRLHRAEHRGGGPGIGGLYDVDSPGVAHRRAARNQLGGGFGGAGRHERADDRHVHRDRRDQRRLWS